VCHPPIPAARLPASRRPRRRRTPAQTPHTLANRPIHPVSSAHAPTMRRRQPAPPTTASTTSPNLASYGLSSLVLTAFAALPLTHHSWAYIHGYPIHFE